MPVQDDLKIRLLIVEDDPIMRMGLADYFHNHASFQVIDQVASGQSGQAQALRLNPDVIIMDIGLPDIDGIAITQQIKSQQPDIRIVMLTSHTTEHEMVAALASGADAYCVKGTSLEKLLLAIACVREGAVYLDPSIAQQIIKTFKPRSTLAPALIPLSERELEVLRLLVEGKSNPEIAQALYLSVGTVKTHVRSILNKLAVDDRVQAAVVALRAGLV
ncbi:MAG: response regulator transcription factor [Cyanobacteriota bacterium]